VQKPNNIDVAHPGLHSIYYSLQEEHFGSSVCVTVFWFGEGYPYSEVLCGPFVKTHIYHEHFNMIKHLSERAAMPHAWTQVILFGGVNSTKEAYNYSIY